MDLLISVCTLHALLCEIWRQEQIPKDWEEVHLFKIVKKGNFDDYNNYRGIFALSIPGKVFCRINMERLKSALDERSQEKQAGNTQSRSCPDQIAPLWIIVEQSIEWNSMLDFEKAFGSLD